MQAEAARQHRVAIIGAGAGGLCMAARLLEAGFADVQLFEKAPSLGGTWHENRYPGAGCDVPSHLYCFSFAPNPAWSRGFAEQPEILAYLRGFAARRGIDSLIRFNTEIISATFNAERGLWQLSSRDGGQFEAEFLVAAQGQLNRPHTPALPALEEFEGAQFHSARWDERVALDGKRIGVVGTGASAVQLVPELVPRAAKLTVFQRSPSWIIPKPDRTYFSLEKYLFRRWPLTARLHRYHIYWQLELRFLAFQQKSLLGRLVERVARKELESIADPKLRAALTPDYTIGCKRILISNEYYQALSSPNTELVTQPIRKVTPGGVVGADGREHALDVLIFATGFASTEFAAGLSVTGRGGQDLAKTWAGGAEAFRGLAVNGFPNLFFLYGPNTNLGHNSILFMIENQVDYIVHLLSELRARSYSTLEVREDAMRAYNQRIQSDLSSSVWNEGCTNWYKTDAGKITNNWSTFSYRYRRELRDRHPGYFTWKKQPSRSTQPSKERV